MLGRLTQRQAANQRRGGGVKRGMQVLDYTKPAVAEISGPVRSYSSRERSCLTHGAYLTRKLDKGRGLSFVCRSWARIEEGSQFVNL